MENIVEVRDLTKQFKGFALNNLNFDIKKGFITGFIGANGAGKTTTIRCLMDLIRSEQGEIRVFGQSHDNHTAEIKERIGFVYDADYYYEDLTIEKNKRILAPFYSQWDDELFYHYLRKFQLNTAKRIKHLSKGMRMKFSLAMALSHHPDFIIMDEPTAGLDPIIRRELLDMMQDLIQDEKKAIFFSTHITTDLEKIADFIVFIHDGRIIFQGEKDEFTERYVLIKGTTDQHILLDGLPVIGLRTTDVGFECLADTSEIALDRLPSLLFEQPTLEDIMYYTGRREL
ncbi:sodium ABC transporter ATP-binding protein [Sporosarcina sp. P21c]|uniref:ABC transporter ATP-binding protein n=1 Tax=unclassified Sporosarcina TaxID=2647733 RepID=UPI000C16533E|nr:MULTISPECIES: ABC transporter ATP-binding protein [unclassified Sporosarcina]PIC68181.1 sodium ABC transporter ATP-binding protein [Sporosarcina sp. P16a]PIC84008.1 sodium ABC transporter ATP-binding protein [Sporosarcina sp. P1]PIC90392.1 sodium ABC transporter ATP-binding protein [Sporosarcina sp. P21c]PIC93921.1 sodium ABC transporter ATP-binding protein [Sporosarcina sp. P25]